MLALLNRPRLLILDLLTQGLDPSARRGVWSAVDRFRRDGVSVLLVTHQLDEAEALCDRVVAMRAGRVLDSGAPAELIDRHGRTATVGLLRMQGHDGIAPPAHGVADLTCLVDELRAARADVSLFVDGDLHGLPATTGATVLPHRAGIAHQRGPARARFKSSGTRRNSRRPRRHRRRELRVAARWLR